MLRAGAGTEAWLLEGTGRSETERLVAFVNTGALRTVCSRSMCRWRRCGRFFAADLSLGPEDARLTIRPDNRHHVTSSNVMLVHALSLPKSDFLLNERHNVLCKE